MLHTPLSTMTSLPSFAFLSSPAETERGAIHEFVLQHSIVVLDPPALVRTTITMVGP